MPLKTRVARFRSRVPVPRQFAWDSFTGPGMFDRLSPPWQNVETISVEGSVRPGDRRIMRLRAGPLSVIWEAVHEDFEEGRLFSDRQVRGPFASWRHRHAFQEDGKVACIIEDEVSLALPLGFVAHSPGMPIAGREMRRLFRYRHFTAFHDLREHYALRDYPRRRVSMVGGPPDVVQQLSSYLQIGGHSIAPSTVAVAPDGVLIELAGDMVAGLQARIRGGADGTIELPIPEQHVLSGMILDGLNASKMRRIQSASSGPGGALLWSTVDDFIAAVHRAVLGLQNSERVFVAHPRAISTSELAFMLGAPMFRATRLLCPSSSDESISTAIGGSGALPVPGVERETRSRYRAANKALQVMSGKG